MFAQTKVKLKINFDSVLFSTSEEIFVQANITLQLSI